MSGVDRAVTTYVAGPLGFSEDGRCFYNGQFLPMLRKIGFTVLDPWKLTDVSWALEALTDKEEKKRWQKLNPQIGFNNASAIRDSDLVVAILDGTDVDSGTAAEIGFAAALEKPIVGYRGDFRLSADNPGSIVNLQVEYFVRLRGGEIVSTIDALRRILTHRYAQLQS